MPATFHSSSQGDTLILNLGDSLQHPAAIAQIHAAAVEALIVAEASAEVRSVVIACTGQPSRAAQPTSGNTTVTPQETAAALAGWIEAISSFPKPVIAAIEHQALDGAFCVALACDFIVASTQALFRFSDAPLGGGASWHLGRMLPRQAAAELLLAGSPVDAGRLHQWGIVNQITGAGQALPEALVLAERLNQHPPQWPASLKELLGDACGQTLPRQLMAEREHLERLGQAHQQRTT